MPHAYPIPTSPATDHIPYNAHMLTQYLHPLSLTTAPLNAHMLTQYLLTLTLTTPPTMLTCLPSTHIPCHGPHPLPIPTFSDSLPRLTSTSRTTHISSQWPNFIQLPTWRHSHHRQVPPLLSTSLLPQSSSILANPPNDFPLRVKQSCIYVGSIFCLSVGLPLSSLYLNVFVYRTMSACLSV